MQGLPFYRRGFRKAKANAGNNGNKRGGQAAGRQFMTGFGFVNATQTNREWIMSFFPSLFLNEG